MRLPLLLLLLKYVFSIEFNTFSKYSIVNLQQYTYSIGCTTNICFSFLSSFCKTGVKVYCNSGLCSEGTTQVGNKCLYFSDVPVPGYSAAQEFCKPFQLVSSLKKSDIESMPQLNAPISFFTSGLRVGSSWKWSNGDVLDDEISGTGRCLALLSEQLVAVDCDSVKYAICEVGRECISKNDQYFGRANKTAGGKPCLRWDDPSVLFERKAELPILSHNFCRFVQENQRNYSSPVCYEEPNKLSPCYIPICPESFNDAVSKTPETCQSDSFSCDSGSKCISEKFRCDYEVDCNDGTDETDCEDYLQYYELIGAYRLADNIIEVWTFIPHVQGCARKCRESLLMCEAFSYEPKAQTCLLTDTSQTFSSLAQKITSLYYKRRFSSKDVLFQVENNILFATKNNKRGQVCDENFNREKLSSICRVLGFGDSIYTSNARQFDATSAHSSSPTTSRTESSTDEGPASSSFSSSLSSSSVSPSNSISRLHHTQIWNLTCLREPNCISTQFSTCQPIRCSRCQEAACADGSCVKFSQLCDGVSDCSDGFDESTCEGRSFRLINGSDTSGYLEVLFRSTWEPVCAESFSSSSLPQINSVCDTMRLGEQGRFLPTNRTIQVGWNIDCNVDCTIRRSTSATCRHQARLSCTSTNGITSSEQCGLRKVEVNARDAARSRYARVVGGFTTEAGAFPWTAAIRIKKTSAHHCGASILDRTHLITAAHCFEDDERPSTYEVVVGEWDNNQTEGTEQFFDVIKIHFYPLYKDIFSHDIAIIEIPPSGIRYDDYVQPICLPNREFVYTPGRQCVVSGWGSMGFKYADKLQAALIPIIDRFECVNSSQIYQSMSRSAFCAGYLDGGIDSCQGDSGGPFACRRQDGAFELAGVISWGDGCAQKKQPGIYTMVAPYLSWINSTLNNSL